MSAASGIPPSSAAESATSAFERIANARRRAMLQQGTPVMARPVPDMPQASEPVATVTLDKIGDFLELDFRRLFVWLRAGLALACMLAVVGGVIGGAYSMLSKQRYTVNTEILINPGNLQVVENDLYAQPGQVDSQLLNARSKQRILTSGNVLSRVVSDLDLANDPEFFDPDRSASTSGGGANGSKSDPKLIALKNLAERVSTTADETSFVTTLSVSAETTDKAILISQAIVKTFQEELAKAEAADAGRAAAALDGRLGQLKRDVQSAEQKVEAYRRSHNLSSSNGQLVSSQTMTQLNSQIVEAQSRVIAAQASYDALVASGANGTNSGPATSEALAALREKANSLRQQIDSQSMTFGPRHPTIVRLKTEFQTVSSQLRAEFSRTVGSAKVNLDAAKASLASLGAKMNDLKGNVFTDSESEVALRELERDAASKTSIYESFLSRARQITEREQIDSTNVQVISSAVPPKARSWPPRTALVIGMGAFAGFALGMLLAIAMGILRDMRQPPNQSGIATSRA
ncbi:MAG: lipopolysaccharide biosynthesis protein [Mesorhizobium sp.]|uniref:GumC family protein n=1 Tax=Mesorhizobium sp. TaxID=1871066 RepID=UPI00121A4D64|nr:GumC family protein [Mesorhizobium sp.]TIS55087.1 MAG: lipopolysaccharide biosynthesis protein [Mesorhizobium sp.]TIS92921.1 MAG: lipopolysaccharide biosynthesis protein [Mesorhizobium sp.]TJW14895.1 MAG: lipopolysaccharide biosynthesis protein [Mesorhizobium sp.]